MPVALDLYRLLVESVRDYAIFHLDPEGYVASWNIGAERIKGYRADEIIGKHFSTFYPEGDKDKPPLELKGAIETGRYEDEGWRVRKDGSRFWASVVITALREPNGTLVGFAKVTRDLTERRMGELRAIEDTKRVAAIEAANRTRLEFVSALSHELRTPLNAIGGYADLLLIGVRGTLTDQQREDLERIRRSQQHLLLIINDLLNYSRIDAGRIHYDVAPVPILEVVDNVGPIIDVMAVNKQITLERDGCSPDLVANADRTKVEQILLNLLSNSIKFTPSEGRIRIFCGRLGNQVSVSIEDTGIGIPSERLEQVFEPFVQLGRSLTSAQEGTGLGLAISRELARAMGGDLTAVSEPGAGSTFTVTLPSV
ncbi:MAG: PAS domain-containing sensor histidine kinase [Gemmatimonadota bacterium]